MKSRVALLTALRFSLNVLAGGKLRSRFSNHQCSVIDSSCRVDLGFVLPENADRLRAAISFSARKRPGRIRCDRGWRVQIRQSGGFPPKTDGIGNTPG